MSYNRNHGWDTARTERARSMWIDGHSASEIARTLGGVSRNGVIGKIHRLGLTGRTMTVRVVRCEPMPPRRIARPKMLALPAPKPPKPSKPTVVPLPPAPKSHTPRLVYVAPPIDAVGRPEGSKTILELASRDCKFPVGEDAEAGFLFCAARREEDDDAYCPHHRARCGGKRSPLAKTVPLPGYARR